LDYKTCYEQADKLGLIDKNVGFGRGQRPPLRLDRAFIMRRITPSATGRMSVDKSSCDPYAASMAALVVSRSKSNRRIRNY
jgi:hypothetical protein